MLTTPHILVGMALATQFPFPLGLALAFLSHFALDFLIPHWNPHLYTEMKKEGRLSARSIKIIFIDGLIGLGTIAFLWVRSGQPVQIILASLLATLPDWAEIPYYFLGFKPSWMVRYVTFEHKRQAKAGPFWGLATQILIAGASLWLLLK